MGSWTGSVSNVEAEKEFHVTLKSLFPKSVFWQDEASLMDTFRVPWKSQISFKSIKILILISQELKTKPLKKSVCKRSLSSALMLMLSKRFMLVLCCSPWNPLIPLPETLGSLHSWISTLLSKWIFTRPLCALLSNVIWGWRRRRRRRKEWQCTSWGEIPSGSTAEEAPEQHLRPSQSNVWMRAPQTQAERRQKQHRLKHPDSLWWKRCSSPGFRCWWWFGCWWLSA